MGRRFKKSVKICKGVKVNFSKSGASLSLGGRGNRINIGPKGVRQTIGIPGIGVSRSTRTSWNSSSHKTSSSRSSSAYSQRSYANRSAVNLPSNVQILMNSDGKVVINTMEGMPITDESVLRRIKATDGYKAIKANLEAQRQELLERTYADALEENDRFINIHRMSPSVDDMNDFVEVLESLEQDTYSIPPYTTPQPTTESIRIQLVNEAQTLKGNIFKIGKLRKQYVEDNLQPRYSMALIYWEQGKNDYYKKQEQIAITENARFKEAFEDSKAYMEGLIRGDTDILCDAIDNWISSCELPLEFNVDYEWILDRNLVFLDVDLPEIEDLPDTELTRLSSGNLREKKKTQATLKQEYVTLVLGLSVFISANIFNISPAVHFITISGYTQRRDKEGNICNDYVYSIKYDRAAFQGANLANVDPQDFCLQFENRINLTSTMLMKKIKPFEAAT